MTDKTEKIQYLTEGLTKAQTFKNLNPPPKPNPPGKVKVQPNPQPSNSDRK